MSRSEWVWLCACSGIHHEAETVKCGDCGEDRPEAMTVSPDMIDLARAAFEWRAAQGLPRHERNARRRFDYRLDKLKLDPIARLRVHLAAVSLADASREIVAALDDRRPDPRY